MNFLDQGGEKPILKMLTCSVFLLRQDKDPIKFSLTKFQVTHFSWTQSKTLRRSKTDPLPPPPLALLPEWLPPAVVLGWMG